MSASTRTIQGSAQGSIVRPLLLAVASVVASLAIIGGALGAASAKPAVAPAAPAPVFDAPLPDSAIQPSSVGAPAPKGGNEPIMSRAHGPRVQ